VCFGLGEGEDQFKGHVRLMLSFYLFKLMQMQIFWSIRGGCQEYVLGIVFSVGDSMRT